MIGSSNTSKFVFMSSTTKNITEHKKAKAFDLYMNTDLKQKEICAIVGWTPKTLTKYKELGSWEKQRKALMVTPAKIIAILYDKAYEEATNDKINADALIKIVNSIEKLSDRKTTLSQTINVFREFATWAFTKDPASTKKINELQRDFVNQKMSE